MKVLVTGGSGYIGRHTIVELLKNNHEVISVDIMKYDYENKKDITHYITDLSKIKDICIIFKKHKPDAVIHFAAYKSPSESINRPLEYYYNNINCLLNILYCMNIYGTNNLVFSSSCSVYGDPKNVPVTEEIEINKVESPYANTKKICEEIIKDFVKVTDIKCTILRYFNPVGCHPDHDIGQTELINLFPIICNAIKHDKEIEVYGNCTRDFVHVVDIANAHILSLEYILQNSLIISLDDTNNVSVFNLGTSKGYTVLEVILTFEKVINRKLKYKLMDKRESDPKVIYCDNSKSKEVLNWNPKYSLEEMVTSELKFNNLIYINP